LLSPLFVVFWSCPAAEAEATLIAGADIQSRSAKKTIEVRIERSKKLVLLLKQVLI
jgi:hypothetical protein